MDYGFSMDLKSIEIMDFYGFEIHMDYGFSYGFEIHMDYGFSYGFETHMATLAVVTS